MSEQEDNIFRYLDNQMSLEEKANFEQLLQTDKALAKEVEFQRGLLGFLDREQPVLEGKLDKLGDEFILKQNNRLGKKWLWGIGILAVVLISIIAFFMMQNDGKIEKLPVNEGTSVEEKSITPEENPVKEAIQEEENPPIEIPQKEEKIKPKPPKNQPIAALDKTDFEKNTIMERLIADSYRDNADHITTIIEPRPNTVFKAHPLVNLKVIGQTNNSPDYELIIYSNRSYDIENDYRMVSKNLEGQPKDENFNFRFNGEIPFHKGLYYLVIRQKESRKLLHISRFTVE